MSSQLWETQSFTVKPWKSREGYQAEIADQSGGALATTDGSGTVRDSSGTVLLQAPIQSEVPRHGTPKIEFSVTDGTGTTLGSGRVVKYGIGPRSKKATVAVTDAQGNEVVRLEPADKKGEQLAIHSDGNEVASVAVEEVK